jgi:hypothetical protein
MPIAARKIPINLARTVAPVWPSIAQLVMEV